MNEPFDNPFTPEQAAAIKLSRRRTKYLTHCRVQMAHEMCLGKLVRMHTPEDDGIVLKCQSCGAEYE